MAVQPSMNAAEVEALIRFQVGDAWNRRDWPHGVSLDRCVMSPPVRGLFHAAWDPGERLELWLVLEEDSHGIYCIAFDDAEQIFGIATRIDDGLLLLGFYGSFVDTLESL